MQYWGFSATVGLPGFSLPLVEVTDPRQAPRVDAAIQQAFDVSIANMMTNRLAAGVEVEKAESAASMKDCN